ncbi:MAG: hypothetical protein ABIK85_08890 [Candidatus Eisenbacteria bacterium]
MGRLQATELPDELRGIVGPLASLLEELNQRIFEIEKELTLRFWDDPAIRLLTDIPGIGFITAEPDGTRTRIRANADSISTECGQQFERTRTLWQFRRYGVRNRRYGVHDRRNRGVR